MVGFLTFLTIEASSRYSIPHVESFRFPPPFILVGLDDIFVVFFLFWFGLVFFSSIQLCGSERQLFSRDFHLSTQESFLSV